MSAPLIAAPQIRNSARQLIRALGILDQHCGLSSITPTQAHLLIELTDAPKPVERLSDQLCIHRQDCHQNLAILVNRDLLYSSNSNNQLVYGLSAQGQALAAKLNATLNTQVSDFLSQMDQDEIAQLDRSLNRYQRAITASQRQQGYQIRLIESADNPAIAAVIRRVSQEYGLSADKGYSVADPHLDQLASAYQTEGAAYWVIEYKQRILGGGGIAPLQGETGICELQKMYFLPELRGKGLARKIAAMALKFARQYGFEYCYLETTPELETAIALYHSLGFERIEHAMGNTGHDACEVRMLKSLRV